jgi:uncharacterized GH25 family protein
MTLLPNLLRGCLASCLLFALLSAAAARAHDFWIEPASFRPAVGKRVPVALYVGQDFKGDSVIFLPGLFERFAVVTQGGEKPIDGIPGDDPAGAFTPAQTGLHTLVYRSTLAQVSFDTREEFDRYLDKEGLERVRALPGYREGRTPIREVYSRCAKSLVAVGGQASNDHALGLRLELIAEKNPYAIGPKGELPVRLLFENQPLEGALIQAFTKAEPMKKIKVRTDKAGRAALKLDRPGTWLLTAVHMIPAPPKANAQWESLWASLDFEIPGGQARK